VKKLALITIILMLAMFIVPSSQVGASPANTYYGFDPNEFNEEYTLNHDNPAQEMSGITLTSDITNGVPPFLVPPIMRESLPLPLIVQPLLLACFRSIFWQTRPESGSPASCADGPSWKDCTPASSFPQ